MSRRRRQFILFVAVGILNTGFGYGVFATFILIGVPSFIALLISTIIGIFFNFITTGFLVFRNRNIGLFWRFILAYGVLYLVNLGVLKGLQYSRIAPIPAQGMCLLLTVPLSYVLQKTFVFKKDGDPYLASDNV